MCDLHICRICLNSAVRGYRLEEHSLRRYYEFLTQEKLNSNDGLPQWVCYECGMMLHKFHKFKEKCLRGQHVLQQINLRGKVTFKSVAIINRFSEKLISSIAIATVSKRVQTKFIKYSQTIKHTEVESQTNLNNSFETVALEKTNNTVSESISNNVKNNTNSDVIITNLVIKDTYDGTDNNHFKDHFKTSGYEQACDESNKHRSINKVYIIEPSNDLIKTETSDGKEKSEGISNKFDSNIKKTIDDTEKHDSNSKNTSYEVQIDFDITDRATSSDDESLMDIKKKTGKLKCKTESSNTKTEPKVKRKKSEKDKEVVLKNTRPSKQVLNPQFWKKINLSEEEAIREFKSREFNNDYYLKARYKCKDCFKGFSKNEMLERHLKQKHDESCGDKVCRFCHMRFRLQHQLVKHIKDHLIVYNCLICKVQCTRLCNAMTHQERHMGTKKSCKYCGKEFSHLSTYYTHVRMSHRSAHVCAACGASFVSAAGLQQHRRIKHYDNSDKQLEEECRKRREAPDKVDATSVEQASAATTTVSPSQSAPDAEEIYCEKCDITFMSRRAYNIHFYKSDNHDDGDAFAVLHKIRSNHRSLSIPYFKSRPKIPTSCEHCDKDFPSRQAYKKHHQAEHSHIPLYIPDERDICEICGASIQASSIRYHMKSHTGEREFTCPASECGVRFTLKANMQRHYNVKHLGIVYPKYIRKNPGRRKKKTEEILDNDFSPLARTRTGYFL